MGEGGEERLGTNVNYLLEEYGMTLHKDSVVRNIGLNHLPPSHEATPVGIDYLVCHDSVRMHWESKNFPGTMMPFFISNGLTNRKETAYESQKASTCMPRYNHSKDVNRVCYLESPSGDKTR